MKTLKILFTIVLLATVGISQQKPMKQWSDEEYQIWAKKFFAPRTSLWNFSKITSGVDRKAKGIIKGNRIETLISNFGSIGAPRQFPSVVWPKGSGRSMGYEFGPVAGAEVTDTTGKVIHIVSDALIDGGERQNPSRSTGNVMGWEPIPGYAADKPNESVAISSKPDTWPLPWKVSGWPGRFGDGIITADEESYFVMDDRFNDEFSYFPLTNNADSIRGLGLQLSCRTYQFASNSAQDILIILYSLKLREDCKKLDKVFVGMVGDPHPGGGADFGDDFADFDKSRNMVYSFDEPGSSNDYGVSNVGYLGFMFIKPEVPDSADWLPLTSFNAPNYGGSVNGANDEIMWQYNIPNLGPNDPPPIITQKADNLFLFGSGYFSLQPGQTQKFAIAILCGTDLNNLKQNADAATQIAKANFQAPRPPELPTVKAFPGDKRIGLYWDGLKSENSIDPFLQKKDFEGYKIYRSDDNGVTWGKPLLDNRGNQIMWEPLAMFDIADEYEGTHPIQSAPGLHMYMGNNSGLRYTFVDSSLELRNGIAYTYCVTAYDRGDAQLNLEPLETPINPDGINAVKVTPNKRPIDSKDAALDSLVHKEGNATGKVKAKVFDPFSVASTYYDVVIDTAQKVGFSILNSNGDTVISNSGKSFNTEINNEREFILNGTILSVDDDEQITILDTVARWVKGNSNLKVLTSWYSGVPNYATTIRVEFFDQPVDTSAFITPKPINFKAYDVLRNNAQLGIVFYDKDANNIWSEGDSIVFLRDKKKAVTSWAFKFRNNLTGSTTYPATGDIVEFKTTIPFGTLPKDVFRLYLTANSKSTAKATANLLDNIKVVPDPYVTASGYEQKTPFRTGRGERVVKFTHLPMQCAIRIYNVAGEHVATLSHSGDVRSGAEHSWNLLNKDGLDVAPGIYIYHVDAPSIGEKIGRFAIIK